MKKLIIRTLISLLVATLVIPTFSALAANTNLIANPSAETSDPANSSLPASWSEGNWGTNSAIFSYVTAAEDGAHAMRVDMTSYASGDAKWYFAPVTVTPATSYDFSDYYQASVPTSLVAQYQTATGATSYVDVAALPASSAWVQAKATITIPANITKVTMFHLISANGNLTIDNASLSQSVATSPTPTPTPTPKPTPTPPVMVAGNLVPNPGVEQAGVTATVPNGWQTDSWGTNTPVYKYLTTGHAGTHSLQVTVTGYTSGDAKWDFAPQAITGGQLYDFSDWYKSTGTGEVIAAITSSTGTTSYLSLGVPATSTTWKQFKGVFTAPAGAVSATVFHLINGNGTLTTDDYALAPDAIATIGNVPNGSLEQAAFTNAKLPSGWQTGGWGTNTSTYTYLSTGHTGTHSIKVATTAFTSGDAVWAYAPQPVASGGRYRFTDWYISNRISEVELQMLMSDGTTQYLTIGHPGVATTWAQFTTIVNLPTGVVAVDALHLIAGVGTLTTDDYSFNLSQVVPFNRPLVSVTFDDGWATQNTNGLPILTQYQMPATFYLISGSINATDYMTTAQVLALKSAGHELASHTITHPDLTTLSATQLNTELSGSQIALQQLFGGSFKDFATPYGTYNQKVVNNIKLYYQSHRSTDAGYNTKDNFDPYNLLVQNVDINTTETQVDGWLAEAKKEGAWLILVYHEVDPNVDPVNHLYNTTPTQLKANFDAIKASGITPVTISQGLSEVKAQ